MARPTIYSEELAAEICARVAGGKSVAEIGRQREMPAERTIWRWLDDDAREAFRQAYRRACASRADVLVDRALTVTMATLARAKSGKVDKAEVAAARLHADMLMRRAGQLAPKKYGSLVRLAGEEGGALQMIIRRTRKATEDGDG